MDSDVHSLHGLASTVSDSGYANSASLARQRPRTRARGAVRSTAATRASGIPPGVLNARLDRLTRDLDSLVDQDASTAGRSLGVTRKVIEHKPRTAELHAGGTELSRPPVASSPPPPKRRRTLPPRAASLSRHSTSRKDTCSATDDVPGVEFPSLRLTSIRSPQSAQRRTVVRDCTRTAKETIETCDGPMELPPFMQDSQTNATATARHSPPPAWLQQCLSGSSRPRKNPTRRTQPAPVSSPRFPAASSSVSDDFGQCPLDAGSSSFYETASSLREYSSLPRPSDPLPYSTSGRNPPHGDNVPVTPLPQARTASLYEAQMSREMHLFSSSVSPVPHPATPLSERHYSLPLPLWRIGTPSQPVHKLEHPMYPASTFPFPLPLYHKHFEPPSSPAPAFLPSLAPGESYTAVPPLSLPNECYAVDQLEEEATTSFWTRGPPPPPALLSKEPQHLVDGRRRYAAQLEREAAELVAPLAQQVDEPGWGVNPERAGVGAEENSRAAGWLEMGSEEDKRHHATREGAPLLSPAPPAVVPRRASLDSHRSTPRSIAQASMFDLSRPPYPPSSSQLTGPRALSSPTPSSQAAPAEQSLPPAAVTPGERNSTSRPPSQAPSLTARAGGANPTTGAGTARGAGSCPHREGVEHEESGDKVQSDAEGSELGAQRWDVLAGGQELRAAAVKAAAALREKAAEAEAGLEGLEEFEIWEDEDEIEEV